MTTPQVSSVAPTPTGTGPTQPNSPQNNGQKKRKLSSAQATVIAAAIAALPAFVAGVFATAAVLPDSTPAGTSGNAKSVIDVTPFNLAAGQIVTVTSPTAANVPVYGTLKSELPSGKQIWVAWRPYNGGTDTMAMDADNIYNGLPCTVDGLKFTCDAPTLGARPTSGASIVYVGLADSNAAKVLAHSYAMQVEGKGPQPAPNSFDVVNPVLVRWP